ncbi:hypothetical protein PHMEG_00010406 [Phytophthora megakarya]|uniref:RNA-directed DNA polymerase n=1 Tax=Phytophthora megakarya TaxID=4795 RepID=A0A225WF48_9STRA|nr:hypothetical protein PHMEG_00010406 [Phytophthora megakarya]
MPKASKRKNNEDDEMKTEDAVKSIPLFTPMLPPEIVSTSHASLVRWRHERRQYEAAVRSRVKTTGEDLAKAMIPVKETFDEGLLQMWCKLRWSMAIEDVTDEKIWDEVNKIIATVKNATLPDIESLFKEELKMDLTESDVSERVLQYFKQCYDVIDEHGLSACFEASNGSKEKCKLLISSLEPRTLRDEVERSIRFQKPNAKEDERELHDLILEKALEQDRQFQHRKKAKHRHEDSKRTPVAAKGAKSKSWNPLHGKSDDERKVVAVQPTKGGTKNSKPPPGPCPKCKEHHWLADCTRATADEKTEIRKRIRAEKEAKGKAAARVKRVKECLPDPDRKITLNGVLDVPYCPDSGTDRTVISRTHAVQLCNLDSSAKLEPLSNPIPAKGVGNTELNATATISVSILIHTAAGPVRPAEMFECLVIDVDEDEFLLGQDILKALGIDIDRQLEQLAGRPTDEDPSEFDDDVGSGPSPVDDVVVREAVNNLIQRALASGFPAKYEEKLRVIVFMFDIWRVELSEDPPAKVPPLEIRLKKDVIPYKCKPRKYTPHLRKFLRDFNARLVELGWVYENPTSRWACPALPVRKPGSSNDHRQTTDYRPVNSLTETMAAVMPILAVILENAKGMKHFGLFDFLKGFWQLPLAEWCQEILSYMTDAKIFTPRRVPQGCSDAAIHFQQTMEKCFAGLLYEHLLIWIDDLLLFAADIETYLQKMQELFGLINDFGLKLSVKKSSLYQTSVKWCGKVVSEDGIAHDPERIACLRSMPEPTNAGELQQFLCAANWMRESLVDYARTVAPLQTRLDTALASGKRTKRVAAGIKIELTCDERQTFEAVKEMLGHSATLAFPDNDAVTCLLTDASDYGWALIVTQVKDWDEDNGVTEQNHQLLTCMSGNFTGSQLNWSVIEKEALPIITACEKLDYLLLRPQGFRMFCDHRNLIHVFAPDKEIKKHVRGKLLRWALKLSDYRYIIEHIEGPKNVWADMFSRWGGNHNPTVRVKRLSVQTRAQAKSTAAMKRPVLRPLDDDGFVWPSFDELRQVQSLSEAPQVAQRDNVGVYRCENRIWVPSSASELIQRLCIIAHCGPQGHRGQHAMVAHLNRMFKIADLSTVVSRFTKRGKDGQKTLGVGETIECDERNGVLHFDFLYLGESFGDSKYVLVLKDHATHFVELVICDNANSSVTAEAILAWHSRFGAPPLWISDNGSHFKNEVISELRRRLKSQQTFTPAYCPWINGSVERVNRDILQVLRAMILEYKISYKDWAYLIPMVQSSLNHTPVPSLGGKAPVELFTGLPCPSPLYEFYNPESKEMVHIPREAEKIDEFLATLRTSIQAMHKPVQDERLKQRLLNQRRERGLHTVNFDVGDYVLRSRVDEKHCNKLQVTWTGPHIVVRADTNSFRVRHLVTGDESDVHPSRLKFYSDNSLDVSEELLEHIAAQGIVLAVNELVDHRWNTSIKDYEIRVNWRGLEPIEDSWEPLASLGNEIPILVDTYVTNKGSALQKHWKGCRTKANKVSPTV